MSIIDSLMKFLLWVFNAQVTFGGYSFSLIGAVCFAGAIVLLFHVLHWLFDGD